MLMRKLKTIKCPVCGCTKVVRELSEKPHTNGLYNEYREFECGYTIHFCPNFPNVSETKVKECFYDPEVKKRVMLQCQAMEKLGKMIPSLDIDEDFKNTLLRRISGVF
jgi:hypothetical protein